MSQQYQESIALQTDLYQLTMAQSYYESGIHNKKSIFSMFFRNNPFKGGFIIFSGIDPLLEKINQYRFTTKDIDYLTTLESLNGKKLFSLKFLNYLKSFLLESQIWSVQEGEIVFPNEPVIKVIGRLIECQLLETLILNSINYSTLVSTKAARISLVAKNSEILEFGYRRAPSTDGALIASRAAYIGGCTATSNLLAGEKYSIPLRGTHGHSYVLSFDDELTAFKEYAKCYPNNLILLVDSYDTLSGVKNAILTAKELPNPEKQFIGIRIDSGDLSYLSIESRKMLDKAGFKKTKIFASNDLDEYIIESLMIQKAKISVWAVGTKLVSNHKQSNFSGVFKLTSNYKNNKWQDIIKISNDSEKINTPGNLEIRRFFSGNKMVADAIYNLNNKLPKKWQLIGYYDPFNQLVLSNKMKSKDLLIKVFSNGKITLIQQNLDIIRKNVKDNLKKLDSGIKRIVNPHIYPVGLEKNLYIRKTELIKLKKG